MKKRTKKAPEVAPLAYIYVWVTPDAKREEIFKVGQTFHMCVKEPASHNLANERVREVLTRELKVVSRTLRLVSGAHSRKKVFSYRLTK